MTAPPPTSASTRRTPAICGPRIPIRRISRWRAWWTNWPTSSAWAPSRSTWHTPPPSIRSAATRCRRASQTNPYAGRAPLRREAADDGAGLDGAGHGTLVGWGAAGGNAKVGPEYPRLRQLRLHRPFRRGAGGAAHPARARAAHGERRRLRPGRVPARRRQPDARRPHHGARLRAARNDRGRSALWQWLNEDMDGPCGVGEHRSATSTCRSSIGPAPAQQRRGEGLGEVSIRGAGAVATALFHATAAASARCRSGSRT